MVASSSSPGCLRIPGRLRVQATELGLPASLPSAARIRRPAGHPTRRVLTPSHPSDRVVRTLSASRNARSDRRICPAIICSRIKAYKSARRTAKRGIHIAVQGEHELIDRPLSLGDRPAPPEDCPPSEGRRWRCSGCRSRFGTADGRFQPGLPIEPGSVVVFSVRRQSSDELIAQMARR